MRRWSRVMLHVVIAATLGGGAIAAGRLGEKYARSSPAFAVRSVEVSGAAQLSKDEVRDIAGLSVGMNIFEVTAITMRERPVFNAVWPATEADFNIQTAAAVMSALRQHYPTVKSVHYPFAQTVIVSYTPKVPGEPLHLAASLMHLGIELKNIIVVDEDVDPSDLNQVFFALTTRVDAQKDVHVLPMMRHVNNPAGEGATVGGLLIDATKPANNEHYEIGKPPSALVEQAASYVTQDMIAKLLAGPRHSW